MQTAVKVRTTVLPGSRVEFTADGLPEGAEVEVSVRLAEGARTAPIQGPSPLGVVDFLASLPPVDRTDEEWQTVEQEFQAERDSWDR